MRPIHGPDRNPSRPPPPTPALKHQVQRRGRTGDRRVAGLLHAARYIWHRSFLTFPSGRTNIPRAAAARRLREGAHGGLSQSAASFPNGSPRARKRNGRHAAAGAGAPHQDRKVCVLPGPRGPGPTPDPRARHPPRPRGPQERRPHHRSRLRPVQPAARLPGSRPLSSRPSRGESWRSWTICPPFPPKPFARSTSACSRSCTPPCGCWRKAPPAARRGARSWSACARGGGCTAGATRRGAS